MTTQASSQSASGRRAAMLVLSLGLLMGACSKAAAPHLQGPTGLAATTANWDALHEVLSSNGSSYGPMVDTGTGSRPTYAGVTVSDGHIAGWIMTFAPGTRIAAAERQLQRDLPSDAEQTSSAREVQQSGSGACEVVSFQSLQTRLIFTGDPALGNGRFSVSFYEVQRDGTIAPSYATVNRAVVGAPSSVPKPTCP